MADKPKLSRAADHYAMTAEHIALIGADPLGQVTKSAACKARCTRRSALLGPARTTPRVQAPRFPGGKPKTITDWSVYLEAVVPEGESRDAEEMAELAVDLLAVLTDAGAAGAVPNAGPRSWSVRLNVECPTARQAAHLAESIVVTSAEKIGSPM